MKTLIKVAISVVVVVFVFSSNSTITNVREYSYKQGKSLYSWGVGKVLALTNNNEKVAEIAK